MFRPLSVLVLLLAPGSPVYSPGCSPDLVGDVSCTIDGGWTSWTSWGPCTGECGSKGKRRRSRSCSNPSPYNEGAPCIGPSYETDNCQITGCTMKQYENVTRGHPVRREEMKIVEAIHQRLPALIELCFSVDCPFSVVEKILGSQAVIYWNAMNCVKYDTGCPVPGGWSSWTPWSSCTAVCGRGKRHRRRVCDNPGPSDPFLTCQGPAFEAKDCKGVDCKKRLEGSWSNWSSWTECSNTCNSGVKVKKRSCTEEEDYDDSDGDKTSCMGPLEKVQPCEFGNCSRNGEWSPWTAWSGCSSDCGSGTQLRNRVCGNPSPSGGGEDCTGQRTEIRQCLNKPCSVITHEVAHFTAESNLLYGPVGKAARLLHVYLRFLPLVPFGTIVHRYREDCQGFACPFVRLSLQNGRVTLSFHIVGCSFDLTHETKLEIGQWHALLVGIRGTYATLRIDNGLHKVAFFSCTLISQNFDQSMKIGEGFHGRIQEAAVNFAAVRFRLPKGLPRPTLENIANKLMRNIFSALVRKPISEIFQELDEDTEETNGIVPYSSSYVQYSPGDDEEGFLRLSSTESATAPCPRRLRFWRVTIAFKPNGINGAIMIIPGPSANEYILLLLDEGRIKLKLHRGTLHSVARSAEHVSIGEWFEIIVEKEEQGLYMRINGNQRSYVSPIQEDSTILCSGNTFVGAIRDDVKRNACPNCADIEPMSFTIGYLYIDNEQVDLLTMPVLETTSKLLSSRTVSLPDHYEETSLPLGQEFKLSCFYNQHPGEHREVAWILMDKPLQFYSRIENFALRDNGRVSSITVASYGFRSEIENFYSCYVRRYKNASLAVSRETLFTFGVAVIDERREMIDGPWNEWIFIHGLVIVLFLILSAWMLIECLLDIRNGHGFYRLPGMIDDPAFAARFVLSEDGIALLGGEQVADEIADNILACKTKNAERGRGRTNTA